MPLAKNLRDLLEIRQHNAAALRRIPGCLGTAVGFKYNETAGEFDEENGQRKPAILVFVEEKIPLAALAPEDRVPERFRGRGRLECHSDVIVGKPPELITADAPTEGVNGQLVHDLHNKDLGIIGGVPIKGSIYTGTAGVVLRAGGRLGVLTNFHVAGFAGTNVRSVGRVYDVIGTTTKSIFLAPEDTDNPDDLESFANPNHPFRHRADIGFVELDEAAVEKARPGVFGLAQPLGDPFKLRLDDRGFDPIGRYVVGVGQKLGRQEGRIIAYGYEWRASLSSNQWYATDYLIKSEGELPFAAPGDSGKLVVTNDEERQPIALLWGGERHYHGNVPAQTTCAYATDIGLVLQLLDNAEINWEPSHCER